MLDSMGSILQIIKMSFFLWSGHQVPLFYPSTYILTYARAWEIPDPRSVNFITLDYKNLYFWQAEYAFFS